MTQISDTPATPTPPVSDVPAPSDQTAPALSPTPALGPIISLNAFQVLMRQWAKLHPYNAGQVVRVSGAPDLARWQQAAQAVITELGLGHPHFSGDEAVQFSPVERVSVEQPSHEVSLEAFFDLELNRPFAAGELPIRFSVLAGPPHGGGESHYLAAVYDHWIADSRAMRELMHRIFERYQRPDTARLPALTLAAPSFRQLYGKFCGPWARLTATRESLKSTWRHRSGFRPFLRDPLDFNSHFLHRELPAGLITRLHKFCKTRGASVNDLFIAVIGQCMGAYTAPDRAKKAKKPMHFLRRQIGIGTIVDIRESASMPLDNVFNLYLSSYTVLLDDPEKRTTEDLTRIVNGETSWIKRTHGAVRGCWAMLTAQFWFNIYESARFRSTLLYKTVPVVAGISNVNMTRSWADAGPTPPTSPTPAASDPAIPQVLDYLRISPSGPLSPLVFTLTTIGPRLSLCVTYRTTSFREDQLHQVVEDFIQRLQSVDKP